MGKVLKHFTNGFPGTVSRSLDNVIISMRNGSGGVLNFGVPVFQYSGENTCEGFDSDDSTAAKFLGFTVRTGSKTPDTYGSSQAGFAVDDPVDVLVRGSVVVTMETSATPGAPVYIRKSDGKLVTNPGAEGSTLLIPNATVRTTRDSSKTVEIVLTKRNLM